ncbi:proline-rich protein 2-like [Melospiza georgiana]|uniref:proline-rich protein 2-like n=1 Tax=Melospiza georgiana TaxID=44398 RepID=UPI0025AB7D3E|nr:proline-rich protein 2-like [Melospiza georgiana]
MYGIDGQTENTEREHTCGTASISAHACERRAEPEPQPPAGTGRPISPPRGPPWPPSPPPPRGRSTGTVSRPPRSGGARSRRGTAGAAGRAADAEGGGAERGTGAGVRPLSPAPGAGRTAAAPGPGSGRGAALPVRRDKPQPLRSTEGAAGRSRSSRRVADPPPFTFPPPLPLPPRLLPGSAAARQVPASAPAGPSRRTRAPAPRRPFVWDRHRDPRPPTPRTPPRPLAPPAPLSRAGPYGRGAGKRGGKRRPSQGSASHRSRGGGEQLPRDRGWEWGGNDPSVAARPL